MSDKKNKNEHVVIALFPSKATAESAVEGLKSWDGANDDVKLGAIGTISSENGKIKTHVPHQAGKGAGVGAVVGVIAGILSGGLTLLAGAAMGVVGGGAIGAFMQKSLHITKEEIAALGPELEGGKVALVVTCDDHEIGPTQKFLTNTGGSVTGYVVPAEAIEEAVEAGVGSDVPEQAEPAAEAVAAVEASAPPSEPAENVASASAEGGTVEEEAKPS